MKTKNVIRTKRSTHLNNHNGWLVWIDGVKYHIFTLTETDAVTKALEKHSKQSD